MNYTNSPYEHVMKEVSHTEMSAPHTRHRKERFVRGVLIGGKSLVVSVIKNT